MDHKLDWLSVRALKFCWVVKQNLCSTIFFVIYSHTLLNEMITNVFFGWFIWSNLTLRLFITIISENHTMSVSGKCSKLCKAPSTYRYQIERWTHRQTQTNGTTEKPSILTPDDAWPSTKRGVKSLLTPLSITGIWMTSVCIMKEVCSHHFKDC